MQDALKLPTELPLRVGYLSVEQRLSGSKMSYIYDLQKKISVLADVLSDTGRIERNSRAEIARFCKINKKTLEAACDRSTLSTDLQQRLSMACGFNLEDVSWIDRKIPQNKRHLSEYDGVRRDSARDFREHFTKVLGVYEARSYRFSGPAPMTADADFASVAITDFGQHVAEGSALHVFAQVSLSPGYAEEGIKYGFKRVRVSLHLDQSGSLACCNCLGEKTHAAISDASILRRGTSAEPFWELYKDKAMLEGEYQTLEEPLTLINVKDTPSKIAAELSAHLHDGTLLFEGDTAKVSTNKQRIIERLMALMVDEGRSASGRLYLSKHELSIVVV